MRVAITRAAEDAGRTAAKVRALGHEAVVAPLTVVRLKPLPVRLDFVPSAVIFTSRNAVRSVAAWTSTGQYRDVPVYTVGDATAALAREAGFRMVLSAGRDAAALAALLIAQEKPGKLLYPTAPHRRTTLEKRLEANGFEVRAIEAYAAEPAGLLPAALATGEADATLLHSERTARILVSLAMAAGLKDSFAKMVFYVIAPRVGDALRDIGGEVRVSSSPNESALLALLGRC